MTMSSSDTASYVVVGGGIAGVTCIETLSFLDPDAKITLISASPLIKKVTNFVQVTRVGETFDVEEHPLSKASERHTNIHVIHAAVDSLSAHDQRLVTSTAEVIDYDKLCICTGGRPKVVTTDNQFVIGIRDTESVQTFQARLKTARRVVIIGNGGIATELVYELEGCEVVWAIKDKSIANTFVDAGAGQFFLDHLNKDKEGGGLSKRLKYTQDVETTATTSTANVLGGALGPDWSSDINMRGGADQISKGVQVEYEVEVLSILTPEEFLQSDLTEENPSQDDSATPWPVYISLSNKKTYGCDLIISATGVTPFADPFLDGNQFDLSDDRGIKVNSTMETSEKNVYAAGDVCTANWELSPHWIQMRLWSQARQMGCYAAKCMVAHTKGEEITPDFCFELFAHVTKFFNFKVVLLGKFNSQGLGVGVNQEILLRYTKGEEYVKAVLVDNRLVGVVLLGETDLEETFENLILNGMDLSPFKEHLLDPAVDIEDFFD